MKTKRKGFTIVELVIVIAVIAILAAVLIPVFAGIINKANESTDTQLVRNLNTVLAADSAMNGKHENMQSALDAVNKSGFDVAKIMNNKATENTILWDSKNDVFCYLKGDKVEYIPGIVDTSNQLNAGDYMLWKIYTASEKEKVVGTEEKYSAYLSGEGWTGALTVSAKGIDVGKVQGITSVTYNGSEAGQNVIVRTDGGTLTVNAANDDVKHYGFVGALNVTAVRADHCYHEYGFVEELVSFGTGKFVVESTALFHQTKAEVAAKFEGKLDSYVEGKDSQYSQHVYDENGICIVDGCNETTATHVHSYGAYQKDDTNHWKVCSSCSARDTAEAHVITYSNNMGVTHDETCTVCGYTKTGVDHTFVDGVCACGKNEIVAPSELHLTGVVTYENVADHSCDDGTIISDVEWVFYHDFTVTYTIPEGTPANATIICDPVEGLVQELQTMFPGIALGFTYKIVDNSGNNFNIDQCTFTSEVAEAIKLSTSIIQKNDQGKWFVLKADNTYYELDESYIPHIVVTEGGYFEQYVDWLKSNGKTTYSSVSNDFLNEYYSTHSKTTGDRFIDYLNGLVAAGTVTMDQIMDSLCGTPDTAVNTRQRHCEGEVIRLMLDYSYRKALGFTFVQNTKNGWHDGVYTKIYRCQAATNFGVGFFDWSTLAPTELPVSNVYEVIENGATLNYAKNGNVTTGGIALLWHAYAGDAWQDTAMCEPPYFTITLKSGN